MARLITNETPTAMRTEAELCILLCSMFPKDFSILTEDLVVYGMGLDFFANVHDIMGARYRVSYLIDIINELTNFQNIRPGYSLLIKLHRGEDKYDNQYVRMLAGAYDLLVPKFSDHKPVGREIVMRKWGKKNKYEHFYGLSLVLKKVRMHPVKLEFPNLAILQIKYGEDSQTLPVGFFEGMKDLRVLSLDAPSLPESLNVLKNLRTLLVEVLKLEDVSAIRGLINLHFLSISSVRLTDIPKDIGQLHNLRSLDLSKMIIRYIPPGVFSRMLKLEELYLPLSFKRWGCRQNDEDDDYYEWKSD